MIAALGEKSNNNGPTEDLKDKTNVPTESDVCLVGLKKGFIQSRGR